MYVPDAGMVERSGVVRSQEILKNFQIFSRFYDMSPPLPSVGLSEGWLRTSDEGWLRTVGLLPRAEGYERSGSCRGLKATNGRAPAEG